MATNFSGFGKGIFLKPIDSGPDAAIADPTDNIEGSFWVYQSKLKVFINTAIRELATLDETQIFTNKSIDADNNTITELETDNLKAGVLIVSTVMAGASDTTIPSALAIKTYIDNAILTKDGASEISYDPSTSGLTVTDVQAAIDQTEGRLNTAETGLSDHLADTADAHDASAISLLDTAAIFIATEIETALNEVKVIADTNATASADLSTHLADATDAHDASAISNIASGNLAATDVQGALNELQTELDAAASGTDLSNHLSDTTDAHDASAISNVASGNLVATDVQAALNELQTELDGVGAPTASAVTNVASGNLLSSNVQDALNELQTDIDNNIGTPATYSDTPAGAAGNVTIYADKSGTVGNSITVTGDAAGAFITQTVEDSFVSTTINAQHLHQTFLVGPSDVDAESITLKLHRTGTSGTVKVNIHNVDISDNIGTQIVSSGTIAINTMTTDTAGADVTFTWSSPPTLTADTRYTFVVDMSGISTSDVFTHKSTADVYADGTFYKNTGSWTAQTGDAYFTLFSSSGSTVATLISDWNSSNPTNTATVTAGSSEVPNDAIVISLAGGVSAISVDNLSDVDTTTSTPTIGDSLQWDGTNFIPSTSTGTANEIDVAGSTIGLSDDPVLPGTGATSLPDGTTAQRPGSPTNNMIRYNTDNAEFEGYADDTWGAIGGAGGGGLDVFHTETFEKTGFVDFTTGNAAAPDAAGTGTLDGTLADETSNNISDVSSLKYTSSTTSDNDFFIIDTDIVVDKKQRTNEMGVSFYFTKNGISGDMKFIALDQDDNVLTSDLDLITKEATAKRFTTSFTVPASATGIRYGFQTVTGITNGVILVVDDIELSLNPFAYKQLTNTSYASGANNGSTAFTAGITDIVFTEVEDSHGAFNGSQYTVQNSSSIITINGNFAASTNANWYTGIYKNGTLLRYYIDNAPSSSNRRFTFILTPEDFSIGDNISIRIQNGSGTLSADASVHWIKIVEQWDTEHVVTPASSKISAISYSGYTSGGASGIKYKTLDTDRGNDLLSTDNTGSKTVITLLKDAYFHLSASNYTSSGGSYFEPTWFREGGTNVKSMDMALGLSSSVGYFGLAGDYFEVYTNQTVLDNRHTSFSVTAIPVEANFLAAVPVQKVAFLHPLAGTTYRHEFIATTSFKASQLDHVSGDTEIVSIDSNQFTVGVGDYILKFPVGGQNATQVLYAQLENITDTSTYDWGSWGYMNSGGSERHWTTLPVRITVTKPTTFELRTRTSSATGIEMVGITELIKLR